MKRKVIMEDAAVRAAIEALKQAVLAVNGDIKVVSFAAFIDVRHADNRHGSLAVDVNICPCPQCLTRLRNEFFCIITDAAAEAGTKPVLH